MKRRLFSQQAITDLSRWTSIVLFPISLVCLYYHDDLAHIADCLLPLLIVITYVSFCLYRYLQYQQDKEATSLSASLNTLSGNQSVTCIAYASQTGYAERLAHQSAHALQQGGMSVVVKTLNQLSIDDLQQYRHIFFVVSTTGEGDAPDNADVFTRQVLAKSIKLDQVHFAVLALGDRHYRHFCAFGHRLEQWLLHQQATSLFDLVEVDNGDDAALRHWQHHLGVVSGHTEQADWQAPAYETWTLCERHLLNPDSLGAPVYHLRLSPSAKNKTVQWQAGDIAEIGPESPELGSSSQMSSTDHRLPHREYSIASIPKDGYLDLVVRQMRRADGSLGIGSGWLTEYAPIGHGIALRIRDNAQFHTPLEERPLILIGNGTGIAGLRAHLKARAEHGRYNNWLFFGERQIARDFFFKEEIFTWQRTGVLSKINVCFSRDQVTPYYVQHALEEQASIVRDWVAQGAVIMVCGSLKGMAEDVHRSLCHILSQDTMDQLIADHRYRRDVY